MAAPAQVGVGVQGVAGPRSAGGLGNDGLSTNCHSPDLGQQQSQHLPKGSHIIGII